MGGAEQWKRGLNIRILSWTGLDLIWSNTNARRFCGSELPDYHPEATLEGLRRRGYRALRRHEQ
jgi:hypothetical protein